MKVKNSNKILLCILAMTISIPLLAVIILHHKVQTGQFQIERHIHVEDPALSSDGSLDGVKAVKLIGPLHDRKGMDTFYTIITHGNKNSYTLKKGSRYDSAKVERLGDTLVFAYYGTKEEGSHELQNFRRISLVLQLSGNLPVLADNCKIRIASWNADTLDGIRTLPAAVYLKGGASLIMGSESLEFKLKEDTVLPKGQVIFVRDTSQSTKDKFDSTFVPMTGLHIVANNSTVRFIQPLAFRNLQLEMDNGSSLDLSYPFKTDRLSGHLGADTKISADARGLRSIKALIRD